MTKAELINFLVSLKGMLVQDALQEVDELESRLYKRGKKDSSYFFYIFDDNSILKVGKCWEVCNAVNRI